jgi:hypothetical protein
MADTKGILAKAAWKKDPGLYGAGPQASYPDAPAGGDLAATHQIPFSGEGMGMNIERQEDPALLNSGKALPSDLIGKFPSGSVDGPLKYRGWERMILCAMGYEHPNNSPATLAVGAYAHLLELDDVLQDQGWTAAERTPIHASDLKVRRGALGLKKQVSDWVWYSSFINKMSIKGSPSGCEISFELISYDLLRGAYNSANWTLPAGSTAQALFQQSAVHTSIHGVAEGSMTEQAVSGWEITLDNNLKGDDQSSESGVNIEIPVRNGFRSVKLKLDFPRYSNDVDVALFSADTESQAKIILTGPQIASTGEYYTMGFFFPRLVWTAQSLTIGGPGPVTPSQEFDAVRLEGATDQLAAGNYQGIAPVKDSEFRVVLHNEDNFDYSDEV